MQGLGQNNNQFTPTAGVTMDSERSQSVSTLSSSLSQMHKTVERLVEVQEKLIAIQVEHNKFMRSKFDKLIECIGHGVTLQSASTMLSLDEHIDPAFDISEEHHDGSVAVLFNRPDGTKHGVNLPPSCDIFKDLGGATRKTEDKNPPLLLLEFLVVAAWTVFKDGKQKVIIPFLLDWSSKDHDINYVKNWLTELECWTCGQNLVRKVCVAVVLVDMKPCVAIFYKCYDDEDDMMKPRLTVLAPQSLKNTELPMQELQTLFEELFAVGKDTFEYEELKLQKVFPFDENSKLQNSFVATGVKVKDFIFNFSAEKCTKARNEFSDTMFWFVIACCCGKKSENIFTRIRDQLVSYHARDDPAGFRRSVCDAIYDCAIVLAERQVVALKTDHLGVPYDKDATTEDFIVELCKQKELLLNSGKDKNVLFFYVLQNTYNVLNICRRKREKEIRSDSY